MDKISVVIPVYNSEGTIEEVVNRINITISQLTKKFQHEIILVNDSSKDNSLVILKKIAQEQQHVKVINLSKNYGQQSALLAGFSAVSGDFIICLDDDLQTPPEEMGKLIDKLESDNLDVVYGKYLNKKHSLFRNFGTWLNDVMADWLIAKPKELFLSSYFIAKRYVITESLKYVGPYPYLPGLFLRVTRKVGNAVINHNARQKGKSNYTLMKLVGLWLNGFTNFSVKPLRILVILGFLFSIISFGLIVILLLQKYFINPDTQIGWTSTMITIVFFGGIQLMSLGMLGEYIGRIYLNINSTPQYTIESKYNFN